MNLFELGKHFLPINFLTEMAVTMTAAGLAKHAAGISHYTNWSVSLLCIFQWIGVWMYMLSFPMVGGDRRAYFQEPLGGYGPKHAVASTLKKGGNGDKGGDWFERMQACFQLPVYDQNGGPVEEHGHTVKESNPRNKTNGDKHRPTRRMWDAFRCAFYYAVVCSWLMVLDESMVKWTGRGMPGLMVILRKPTPVGLEIHTLCCALCGILCWFEVYEGKQAMAEKPFNDQYPKSVALTLRMVEPFFQTGRVLIADSWFGSVACALALFKHCIFCVMNVKTGTKEFPKDEMMAVVDEVKGKSAEVKAARKARRGKKVGFVRNFKVGSRSVTLTAGGHNKRKPRLMPRRFEGTQPEKAHSPRRCA